MSANHRNASSNIQGSTANTQLVQDITPGIGSASDHKAVIVGLYGVPGSGKIFLLNQLKRELVLTHFAFYEGSMMIVTIVPGDLDAFQSMEESEKADWCRRAIDATGKACTDRGQVGVVTGHYVFWSEKQEAGRPVVIEHDLKILTYILYLDIPAEIVARCCLDDTERGQASTSASHSGTDERLFLSNLPNKPQNHTLPIVISLQRSPPIRLIVICNPALNYIICHPLWCLITSK